jgi:hypothetical protein
MQRLDADVQAQVWMGREITGRSLLGILRSADIWKALGAANFLPACPRSIRLSGAYNSLGRVQAARWRRGRVHRAFFEAGVEIVCFRRDAEKFEDERAAKYTTDSTVRPKLADIVARGGAQLRFSDTVDFLGPADEGLERRAAVEANG